MARNAQIKHQSRHTGRQYGSHTIPREPLGTPGSKQRNMKLGLKQIILFWSVTLIMMLVVFVSGFKAGKVEGAREILDQVDQQMVRLPVVRPYNLLSESDSDVVSSKDSSKTVTDTKLNALQQEDSRIDFTKEEKLPSASPPVVAPVVAKKEMPKEVSKVQSGKKEEVYEEIYPGRKLFPPPSQKLEEDTTEALQEEAVIEPLLPEIAAPPAAAQVKKPSIETYAPTPGWYVQIAAAPSQEDARRHLEKMSGHSLEVKIEEASIRDKVYYRILVGPYGERKDALSNRGRIKTASGVSGEPFIRQVK